MDNYELPFDVLQYKLKTARQKKRLQKKDLDKQVIQIIKRRSDYWRQRQNLPWIPLEIPYQSGWKRCFVLRDDIKRSAAADFYQGLLKNINTVQHSPDKSFKARKKRRFRKCYVDRKQLLREIPEWQWNNEKYHSLTEVEKVHFHLYESWDNNRKTIQRVYRFNEPWRYVLKVLPRMITEVRKLDERLESDIKLLDNFITNHNLNAHIYKITGDAYGHRKWADFGKTRYMNLEKEAQLEVKRAIEIKREENIKRNEHFKNKRTK